MQQLYVCVRVCWIGVCSERRLCLWETRVQKNRHDSCTCGVHVSNPMPGSGPLMTCLAFRKFRNLDMRVRNRAQNWHGIARAAAAALRMVFCVTGAHRVWCASSVVCPKSGAPRYYPFAARAIPLQVRTPSLIAMPIFLFRHAQRGITSTSIEVWCHKSFK